jgi:speckle-type POZ protein
MEVNTTVIGRGPETRGEGRLIIINFEDEMKDAKCQDKLESNPFKVGGHKFSVKVYPNGNAKATEGHVGVFLGNKQDEAVKVKQFKLTVGDLSKVGVNMEFASVQDAPDNSFGWPNWFTHEQAKAVLKDGRFEVRAEIVLVGQKIVIGETTNNEFKSEGQSKLVVRNMHKDMSGTDFLLVCEGSHLPAHRPVLAAASPYFKAMLLPETAEAKAGRTNLQCSEDIGCSFIKFVYTGEIEDAVLDQYIESFLCLGDKYAVPELTQQAEARMIQLLSKENMVSFFIAGDM